MSDQNTPAVTPADEPMLQFFAWAHLPEHLAAISRPFGELAERLVSTLPRNPERSAGLRKLLEAKDWLGETSNTFYKEKMFCLKN